MEKFWVGLPLFLRLLCFLSYFSMLDRLSVFSLTKGNSCWVGCVVCGPSPATWHVLGREAVWKWRFGHSCLLQYCLSCIFRLEDEHKLVELLFSVVCWWLLEKDTLTCPGDRQAPAFQYVGTFYNNLVCCCFKFSFTPGTLLLCLLFQQLNNRVAIRSVFPALHRKIVHKRIKSLFFFLNQPSEFVFCLSRYQNLLYFICIVNKFQDFIPHHITGNRFDIYKCLIYIHF